MSTFASSNIQSARQSQAIEYWIAGGRKSKAEALRKAGYSKAVARHPDRVFGSPRVQEELELRGFDKDGFGLRRPLEWETLEATPPVPAPYAFDPQTLPRKHLQELKEKLREVGYIPAVPIRETEPPEKTYMDAYNNLGNADAVSIPASSPSPNFSSM